MASLPDSHPVAEVGARLRRHARLAQGAYAPNTERALRADSAVFTAWCVDAGHRPVPADPAVVAAFVDAMARSRAVATVRRYVASLGALHRAAGVEDPTKALAVRLALRRVARRKGRRPRQATALNRAAVDAMLAIATAGARAIDRRDAALVAVAYDTLARRSELVALEVGDLQVADDGTGIVLIRRSKTDAEGEGAVRFLAPDTIGLVQGWLTAAGISDGPLFRAVAKGGAIGGRLDGGEVARIFRRLATRAGIDAARISGHSTRVGASQDMIAAGLEIGAVMQAGGWKTPAMVARYGERLAVRRGAAARLAVVQRRYSTDYLSTRASDTDS